MLLEPRSTLLMTGDSLTDTGRGRPVGTVRTGLGEGYVLQVQTMLGAFHPECAINVLNTGVSGDTIRRLEARWQEDILDHKPDYVSLLCGVNDVWRQFNIFDPPGLSVPAAEYRERYARVIESTLPHVKAMFLLTPYFLDTNRQDPMCQMVLEYAEIVKDLAARYNLRCLETQPLLEPYVREYSSYSISKDRVHMNLVGHTLLAKGFLDLVEASVFR